MKTIVVTLTALFFSAQLMAADACFDVQTQNDLRFCTEKMTELVTSKEYLEESDGEVTEMNCEVVGDFVSCETKLEFIEIGTAFFNQGSSYQCTETYEYVGNDEYIVTQSDCWFRN
jgi:uncharacterized protein (DUF2164 family)